MRGVTKAIVLIVLVLAVFTPFASKNPDGLEKVAEALGIEGHESVWRGLMPDYTIHGLEIPYLSTLVSGLIGLFLVFIAAWGIGWAIARKNQVRSVRK